ncbi:MAG: hypothetical protein WA005_01320 [Candidatus Binataceae bacterium]
MRNAIGVSPAVVPAAAILSLASMRVGAMILGALMRTLGGFNWR